MSGGTNVGNLMMSVICKYNYDNYSSSFVVKRYLMIGVNIEQNLSKSIEIISDWPHGFDNNDYKPPSLLRLRKLTELMLGQNGSSFDGKYTFTQKGGGNDCQEPHDCSDPRLLEGQSRKLY